MTVASGNIDWRVVSTPADILAWHAPCTRIRLHSGKSTIIIFSLGRPPSIGEVKYAPVVVTYALADCARRQEGSIGTL